MILKYILVFIIINSQLTFIAGNVKRNRKSNSHHTKVKKNKFSDVNPPGFVPTEDISEVGDLEWLSESTKTRNVVLSQSKNKSSEPPKSELDTRDADRQLADYKASQQADDLVSKMSLKKVMVKEIMEVDKVYETGSTEIIINPKDLWNEKNSNQPAMKVVQYLFEKPTTTTPAYETINIKVYESVKTVESTFSPNKLPSEPTEPPTTPPPPPPANNNKIPRRKKPSSYRATRKPTLKPLDFDEFLKVIFGNYGKKKEKERDEVDLESDTKFNQNEINDEDDVKFISDATKNDGKSSDVINVKSKIVQTRNPQPTTTTSKPCDEDEEEVETTVEETNTSVVATKFVEEEPKEFELVEEKSVGKRSKVKRNPAASSGKSSPKGSKRLATPKKKTRSCRKKRVEEDIEIDDTFKTGPEYDDEFSTKIVYTISDI